MVVVSLMTACMPFEPTSAAEAVTLKSPAPMLADDQAEKLPLSKPSTKIRSDYGVFVAVRVEVSEAVGMFVCAFVSVGEDPILIVTLAVGVKPNASR